MTASFPELDAAISAHGRELWGLCYRMTGVAADADELVQETWLRAMENPPPDLDRPLRPWLVRVAANLARDRVRRRRRLAYVGPWLPAPVDEQTPSPEQAQLQRESVSYAWLLAAEALTPNQRAVMLLRDVYELSVRETAQVMGISEGSVKVTLHRARKALSAEDPGPPLTGDQQQAALADFAELMGLLASGQVDAARAVMVQDARLVSDGGGVVNAARVPLVGIERITRFYQSLIRTGGDSMRFELRMLAGLPTMVFWREGPMRLPRDPTRGVTLARWRDGRVHGLYNVVEPGKLVGVRFP